MSYDKYLKFQKSKEAEEFLKGKELRDNIILYSFIASIIALYFAIKDTNFGNEPLPTFVLPLLMLFMSSIFCSAIFKYYIYPKKFRDWPSVSGQIIGTDIKYWRGKYAPSIVYYYFVGGQKYISDRISVVQFTSNRLSAISEASEFHFGQTVDVFYNPKRPSQSVLTKSVQQPPLIVWVCAIILLGAAFYFLVRM